MKDSITQIIDKALQEKFQNLGYKQMQPSGVEFVGGKRELLENALFAGLSDTAKRDPNLALQIATELVGEIITNVQFSGGALSNKKGATVLQIRDDAFSMALGAHEHKVMDQGDGAHDYQQFERDANLEERLAYRIKLLVNSPERKPMIQQVIKPKNRQLQREQNRLNALVAAEETNQSRGPQTTSTTQSTLTVVQKESVIVKKASGQDALTNDVIQAMKKARSSQTLQNLAFKGGVRIANAVKVMSKFNPMKFFKKGEEAKMITPPATPGGRGEGQGKGGAGRL